tara:strand:- start:2073 stop:4496 length:2424 start_codon:yes stop_codon:yes gene_type:complete
VVKIRKYRSQKGVNKSQAQEFSQLRVNPNDFSQVTDALNKVGSTGLDVGLNLFSQQEKNDAIAYEEKKRQDLKLYEQVEKNEVDFYTRKLKLDRSNSLTENMNFAMDGNEQNPGLNDLILQYSTGQDYENNEVNYSNAADAWRDKVALKIKDEVVKKDFILNFDKKKTAGGVTVASGSFKTGISFATNNYEQELKQLYYDYEYGNLLQQKMAEDRLFGKYDSNGAVLVEGIHDEAFKKGIINTTPEVAMSVTRGNLEFIRAKKAVANDPVAFLELSKNKETYPFPNLSSAQRTDLEIKAQNAVNTINNQASTNDNKIIKANQKELNSIVKMLDDGNMPENGVQELSKIISIAEAYDDDATVQKAKDYISVYGVYNSAIQMNIGQLQDELNEVNAQVTKQNIPQEISTAAGQVETVIPGVSNELVLKQRTLQTVLNKMQTALNDDSLNWANTTNLITLETIDWVNASDEEFADWVNTRQSQSALVKSKYPTTVDNFLTKADQISLMNIWQDPKTDIKDKIFIMRRLATFDEDTDTVFSEILYKGEGKNEAGYFAHIAGLMNTRDFDITTMAVGTDFLNGFSKKDNTSLMSQQIFFGDESTNQLDVVRDVFSNTIDGALHQVNSTFMNNIFDLAQFIYIERASGSDNKFLDKKLYASIVQELVGQNTIGGKQYGGFVEYNGQTTLIPSWMKAEDFEYNLNQSIYMHSDKLLNGQIPEWKYGESTGEFNIQGKEGIFNRGDDEDSQVPFTDINGDQPYLWVIDDGVYVVSFNQPWNTTDPQYIGTSTGGNNGYFVLDLNLIKDEILSFQK